MIEFKRLKIRNWTKLMIKPLNSLNNTIKKVLKSIVNKSMIGHMKKVIIKILYIIYLSLNKNTQLASTILTKNFEI